MAERSVVLPATGPQADRLLDALASGSCGVFVDGALRRIVAVRREGERLTVDLGAPIPPSPEPSPPDAAPEEVP